MLQRDQAHGLLSLASWTDTPLAQMVRMVQGRFVYILRSVSHPARYYVGRTVHVPTRLAAHNSGGSAYTAAFRPWELVSATEFTRESSAVAFEKYLKTGSGRAFAQRHFV
jgi:predicted GIY-YIG superfamily endonuclease